MQVKQQSADVQVGNLKDQKSKGNIHQDERTCHQVSNAAKSSLLKQDAFLTPGQCQKTLVKLSLHKGRARKSKFRVMAWLHICAGQLMSTKQKVTYKVIPKEIGSND
jgi:hypothetical protein